MERKFKNNPDFEKQCKEFMNEYKSLGHMSLVNSNSHTSDIDQNFLPPSSTTTKLRVVFDASLCLSLSLSCKTTNDTSLNSLLGIGPKLQRDIFEILLNFRIPKIVFTADIEKMYRQILVADEDQKYQQILWRNNSNENIRTYKLKTVTYVLASASFLATRTSFTLHSIHEDFLSKTLAYKNRLGFSHSTTINRGLAKLQKAFNEISYLTVPRCVILTADNTVELHGFADASSLVLRTLKHYTFDVFAWTDSKIVLSWLSSHPRKWKTFVANRTSENMEVLPAKHWRHVPSKENPADIASRGSSISSSHINTTSLNFSETKTAEETIIRWVQSIYFQEEIQSIKKQISLPPKSPLRSLQPFIYEHGLVRVGGRLQNSQLRFNSKHLIILPSQHSISELLIKEQHIAHLHAGPTFVTNSKHPPQLMGNLPKRHFTLERPFFSCGIDYAGPVLIKCNKGRGTKSTKGYIALFVCLATKAVHIEAVGDLTTDSFIAALRRFSARRGAPRHIYGDNGTNFVGARRKLDEIGTLFHPHHHIWESGIRFVKFHPKRVLGETILTFEELTTLLTQIEGLLNSRSLSYVNDSDIECISTLTPSHFLTGDVLLSVAEELPSTSNHRNRWELLQYIKCGFWKQWSADYLSSLQLREKGQDAQPNLKEHDIVLIKEEGPPGTWPMARVLQGTRQ
ncbi:hypothetical protein TNCV_2210661 [Trichonephila clavipes]|nr:hypothetical protein TNCV_2210661 [Trichonephila clavipes]